MDAFISISNMGGVSDYYYAYFFSPKVEGHSGWHFIIVPCSTDFPRKTWILTFRQIMTPGKVVLMDPSGRSISIAAMHSKWDCCLIMQRRFYVSRNAICLARIFFKHFLIQAKWSDLNGFHRGRTNKGHVVLAPPTLWNRIIFTDEWLTFNYAVLHFLQDGFVSSRNIVVGRCCWNYHLRKLWPP